MVTRKYLFIFFLFVNSFSIAFDIKESPRNCSNYSSNKIKCSDEEQFSWYLWNDRLNWERYGDSLGRSSHSWQGSLFFLESHAKLIPNDEHLDYLQPGLDIIKMPHLYKFKVICSSSSILEKLARLALQRIRENRENNVR